MTEQERIVQLEEKVEALYRLVENVAFNVVEHTTNIDRQINEKLESIREQSV